MIGETVRRIGKAISGHAEADYEIMPGTSCSLSGFYADYNDQVDNANDGSGGGVMAAVKKKW